MDWQSPPPAPSHLHHSSTTSSSVFPPFLTLKISMASSTDRDLLIQSQLALVEEIKWHSAAGHRGKRLIGHYTAHTQRERERERQGYNIKYNNVAFITGCLICQNASLLSRAYFTVPRALGIFKRTMVVFPAAGYQPYCTASAAVNSSKSFSVAFILAWHQSLSPARSDWM